MKIFVIFWLTLCYSIITQAGDQNTPYIYYYSVSKQAFVIEQADGSDSQILTTYEMPKDHVSIEGAGWSPSKKWFAWTSGTEGGGSIESAYIVSRDGSSPIRIFPNDVHITDMSWSPIADLLMVIYNDYTGSAGEQFVIYDPVLQTNIFNANTEKLMGSSDGYIYRKAWSPDGQRVAMLYGNTIVVIQMTGDYRVLKSAIDGADTCSDFGTLPHWFKDGRLAYLSEDKSTLLADDGTNSLPLVKLPRATIRSVDWSPDEHYAQIYVQPSEKTFQYELWLLDVANQSITRLFDNVYFINNCTTPFNSTALNTKNQSVFVSVDGQLWFLDASSKQISQIPVSEEGKITDPAPLRWINNNDLLFIWQNQVSYTAQIYVYEGVLGRTRPIASSVGYYFTPLHGKQVAYIGAEGQAIIEDILTHAQIPIKFQALPEYGSSGISSMFWHPTEDWLFLLSANVEYQYLVNIVSADGKIQRPLSLCPLESKACFGWL